MPFSRSVSRISANFLGTTRLALWLTRNPGTTPADDQLGAWLEQFPAADPIPARELLDVRSVAPSDLPEAVTAPNLGVNGHRLEHFASVAPHKFTNSAH